MTRKWLLGAALAATAFLIGVVAVADPAQNDYRFAILGDRTGDAQPGVYEQIWREIDAWHPDFAINAGDTIQGNNDATAAAEWRALRPLWQRGGFPMYFTPGNHDIWSPASRRIFERETRHPPFYSFDYQDAHFTVLDNSQGSEFSMGLNSGQMEFLDRDLSEYRSQPIKFVFFHKPFWLIPVKLQSGHFPFHELISKYGVQWVISGHGHQYVRAVQDGVTYLEAPSSGGKLKGQGFDRGWFYGWVQVTVKGAKAEMSVKEVGAPFGKGRSL